MNVRQSLINAGLNSFAADLLAESLLKHPEPKRIKFLLPIHRTDCEGWIGVMFTLEPISTGAETTGFDPIFLGC